MNFDVFLADRTNGRRPY